MKSFQQYIFFLVFFVGATTVHCRELRAGGATTEERELLLARDACKSCGRFRKTMRQINPDDSCVESCRIRIRSSNWECGTCDEWNQSYPGFDTTLQLDNVRSTSLQTVFRDAASRWNQIITGDLPSILLSSTLKAQSRYCPARSIPRVIDDILICVNVRSIDGRGGILGQAGVDFIRIDSKIPLLGGMTFDVEDVDFMVEQGIFDEVILHEIGHVYGIGAAIWKERGLIDSFSPPCSYKLQSAASTEWQLLSGCVGTSIPIENQGRGGTVCSHFDEQSLTSELMTGFVRGAVPILSRLTVATLDDIGYEVNYDAAQAFSGVNGTCANLQAESTQEREETTTAMTDSGLDYAIQYGTSILNKNAQLERADTSRIVEQAYQYIGDQTISIVYLDDAGEVRHVTLTKA